MSKKKKRKKTSEPEERTSKNETEDSPIRKRTLDGSTSHRSPNVSAEEMEADLKLIYGEEGETDFTKLEQRPRSALTRFFLWSILTLAVLSGAAWGGYLLFNKHIRTTTEPLIVTIEGPDEITSGAEVIFDVVYEHLGETPLASLEFRLMVPDGFNVQTYEPAATEDNLWNIGPLSPGSDGLIRLKGVWIDPVPSGDNIQVVASYRPANFNSEFQDITTKSVAVRSSVIELTSEHPTTAVPGEDVTYMFTAKNTSPVDLADVRVRLDVPDGFIVDTTSPEPIEAGAEWVFDTIPSDDEVTIELHGSYAADEEDINIMKATSGIMRDNQFLEQSSFEAQTDVLGGGFQVRLITNGSTEDQSVNLGSTLRLSIDVTNNGEEDMDGLEIDLNLSTEAGQLPINWDSSDLADGTRSGSTITWDAFDLTRLGTLDAGQRETVDLSLRLLDEVGTAADIFTMNVEATVTSIAGVDTSRSLESTPITVSLNSDTSFFNSSHYYLDGIEVGTGPVPPEVGQTTQYRILWEVENTLHALDNLTVTATLPPDVGFEGVHQTELGDVSFDESTRVVAWTIERLPSSVDGASATFDVSTNPTSDQVGTFVKLTNETVLVATDFETQARIQVSGPILTTDTDDAELENAGVVIE